MSNSIRRMVRSGVALGSAASMGLANAATDLTAITAAQTDALAVAGALLAMGIAVWGALFVYRKFFK